MIEKYSATEIQLENIQKIMKMLDNTKDIKFTDGKTVSIEINKAYLNDDYSVNLSELSDNPEDNACFININNCEYYIHFGTLVNSNINNSKIFFPKNMIPEEYKEKNLDYLYLSTNLTLVVNSNKDKYKLNTNDK